MKKPRFASLLTAAFLACVWAGLGGVPGPVQAAAKASGAAKKALGPLLLPTAPPLGDPRAVPYPVYGASPVPGIGPGAKKIDGVSANLSLLEAINVAIARSPVLAAARQDVELARANAIATAAPALPGVGLSYQRQQARRQDQGLLATTIQTPPTRDHPFGETRTFYFATNLSAFSSGVTGFLSQLIFDGGKTGYLIRSAYKAQVAQSDTYKRQLQTTVNETTFAYYSTLENGRLMLMNIALVKMFHELEDFARHAVALGKADNSDVASIQEQDLIQQSQALQAQNNFVAAQTALANAMGLDGYADILPRDDAPQSGQIDAMKILQPPSYDRAIARAMLLRPDYASAVAGLESAAYGVKSARRMSMPQVSIGASASSNSTNDNAGVFRNNSAVTLNATLPIFDQGATLSTRVAAQASYDQAVAILDFTRQQVQTDVQTAVTTLSGARAALAIAHQTVHKAAEEMALRRQLYPAGDAQVSDLLDALTTFADALTQEVGAIYNVRVAEQAYYLAVGENP